MQTIAQFFCNFFVKKLDNVLYYALSLQRECFTMIFKAEGSRTNCH